MAGPNFGDVTSLYQSTQSGAVGSSGDVPTVPMPNAPKPQSGSFFGEVGHLVGKTATDLENAAINSIPGTYHLFGGLINHPFSTLGQVGSSMWQDFQHPLRDPGYTLLDALGIFGGGAALLGRVGEAGSIISRAGALAPELANAADVTAAGGRGFLGLQAAKMGKSAEFDRAINPVTGAPKSMGRQLGTALIHGPAPEERILTTPEGIAQHGWWYSKNPGIRAAQKLVDQSHNMWEAKVAKGLAEGHPVAPIWRVANPLLWRSQAGRILSAGKAENLIRSNLERAEGGKFLSKYGKNPDAEHLAVRMVAEGTTPEALTAMHQKWIDSGALSPKLVAESQRRLALIPEAAKFLQNKDIHLSESDRRAIERTDEGQYTPNVIRGQRVYGIQSTIHRAAEAEPKIAAHTEEALTALEKENFTAAQGALTAAMNLTGISKKAHQELVHAHLQIDQLDNPVGKTNEAMATGKTITVPQIRPEFPHLQQYVNDARSISQARENASKLAGVLGEESSMRRILGPLNFALHGKIPANITELQQALTRAKNLGHEGAAKTAQSRLNEARGQMTFEGISPEEELLQGDIAKQLANKAGLFRVPYEIDKSARPSFGSTAFRRAWKGKQVQVPGTYTHPFSAGVLKHGGGATNTAKLLAESYTEAHRFLAFKANRAALLQGAHDTPTNIPEQYRQLIRDDTYFRGAQTYQQAAENSMLEKDHLSPEDTIAAGKLYEGMRQHIFPTKAQAMVDLISRGKGELVNKLFGQDGEQFQKVPGYKWVDTRTLGGLDKQNPLWGAFENPIVRSSVRFFDAVNNAQKAAILYLKPAYAIPNALGNVALNLVQQGFLAPLNLAKSVTAFHWLDKDTINTFRAAMGEGLSQTLKTQGLASAVTKFGNKLASGYGRVIDDPFRFSSFLHEARLNGFVNKSELHALANDPKFAGQLKQIANRANDEIINYERLGPGEQAVLRRLVFFYPWVKGSTRYAAQMLTNHPVTAGALGQAGKEGKQWTDRVLGQLPSYAEGLIPYTTKGNNPLVGNPSSFAILSQPAQLAQIVQNLFENNPNQSLQAAGNLAPVDAGLLTLLTAGKVSSIPHPASESPISAALNETFGGNPIQSLIQSLTQKPRPGALYPDPSALHAILRFAVTGGLTPRVINKAKANATAYTQQHPQGFTG